MNIDWNVRIQKLNEEIDNVRGKEKRHLMALQYQVLPPQEKKVVKFNLPSDQDYWQQQWFTIGVIEYLLIDLSYYIIVII